jgi:serine/threonine protein kinase
MPLTIGTQLGSYEITALLGKGGMGEVYRARDSKLKRDVAIKILPHEFSSDPERVGRFQREAEALALLNHPNIGAIYDIQEANESRFLVLELVEGETLGDRSSRGPIPVEEALKIAQLIAEALEAAHEKGIVHRDLKPANVKLTSDDKVKVLDFGLAKAMESTAASATLSNSPTLSIAATQAGAILGTAAYMSPEQAKGFTADPRSDVFAFGCVLFEMLTGRQLFQGETIHEILGAVLVSQPDLSALPANLNPKIADVLRRCLEKNPRRRWQAIGDLRVELETLALQPHAVPVTAQPVTIPQPLWKRAIPIAITAIVVGIGARLIPPWNPQPSAPAGVTRFSVPVPEGKSIPGNPWLGVSMSPDGKAFVFIANRELYSRSMSESEPRALFSMESGTGDNRITPANTIGASFIGSISVQSATPFAPMALPFTAQTFSTVSLSNTTASATIPTRSLTAGALPDTPTPGTVGGTGSIIFPQFAAGGGWATEISLVNSGTSAVTGRVDFFNPDGSPVPLKLNGSLKSTFTYSIPAGGTLILAPRDLNGQSPL